MIVSGADDEIGAINAPSSPAARVWPTAPLRFRTHALRRGLVSAGFLTLCLLGLYMSLCHVTAAIVPDSDLADPVMLWQGIRAHGLGFLRGWYYNPDNYLLSLIPFTSLALELFGARPGMVVGFGWVILVGCAALATLIAWTVTRHRQAMLVFPLLLLFNQDAIGRIGFLGYAVTHTISLLWGLLSLLAALDWLRRNKRTSLAVSGITLFIGTVSDPWLGAAAALPLIGSDAVLLASGGAGARARLGRLLAVHVTAFCLSGNQAFGLLGFLPPPLYPWASWSVICGNLLWMGRVLTLVFDPLPGPGMYLSYSPRLMLAILTPLCLALLWLVAGAVRRWRFWHEPTRFTALVCVLSCCGTLSGFLLVNLPQGPWMGRFFVNLYVMAPVLGCLVCLAPLDARAPPGLNRHVAAACALLAGIAMLGGASNASAWISGPRLLPSKAGGLARFLDAARLHYGYGAHWASEAEAVTWLSRGHVVIRPVVFDRASGRVSPQRTQSSPLWYRPSDSPAGPFFVVVGQDPLECRDMRVCIKGVLEQFGKPARVLPYQDLQILVWNARQ